METKKDKQVDLTLFFNTVLSIVGLDDTVKDFHDQLVMDNFVAVFDKLCKNPKFSYVLHAQAQEYELSDYLSSYTNAEGVKLALQSELDDLDKECARAISAEKDSQMHNAIKESFERMKTLTRKRYEKK